MDMSGNFDPIKFASVVRKAQGGRSQRAFATDCKISIPRMNLMLNGKIDQAPTQRTLQKIADHAQNGVTLNELIMATTTTDSDKETTEANYMPSLPLLEDSTRDRYAGLLLLAIQRKGCNARPLLGLTRPSLHPLITPLLIFGNFVLYPICLLKLLHCNIHLKYSVNICVAILDILLITTIIHSC